MKARKSKVLGLLRRVVRPNIGWKQAAAVNCILLVVMSFVLVGFLIVTAMQARGIANPIFFYEGPCKENGVSNINFLLHLLINILSTLVLASTNFFMQILNAPSREEIDVAHLNGTWLEIGVSSVRNLFKVSKFKTCCWLGLLVSSIPIHLLANSTVFTTEHRESAFHLTIATDEFVKGGPFYPPGASLLTARSINPLYYEQAPYHTYHSDGGYGTPGLSDDYADKESAAVRHISFAADLGQTWDRIELSDCLEKYLTNCNGLDRHRDIILVANKAGGWTRNEMWDATHDPFGGISSSYWDRLIPANASNHLFYDSACVMSPGTTSCFTDCQKALGGIPTDNGHIRYLGPPWYFFSLIAGSAVAVGDPPTLLSKSDMLSVQYCLAEPLESKCYVGLSTTVLFAVTLCVVVKSGIALLVAIVLPHKSQDSLVTIGDSIASFIEKPDARTAGCAGLDPNKSLVCIGPKKWQVLDKRRWAVVPVSVWATSYLLFTISISVCIYFLSDIYLEPGKGGFFASNTNPLASREYTLLSGILAANSPQLLLSAAYLAYNSLFTRLQMAQEWAMYAKDYLPLRVTDPQGMQRSTYRLQLPYKYSLPLMALSALLHFLVSNTIYVIVSFGGYLKRGYNNIDRQPGLPADSTVLIGYSPISLLVVPIATTILIMIPIILSFKKLPPNMVIVGANSLAISAACHASNLSQARLDNKTQKIHSDGDDIHRGVNNGILTETRQRQSDEYADIESGPMLRNYDTEATRSENSGVATATDVLRRIARNKIRWGVVEMPPEWYKIRVRDKKVGHLSFGVEEDGVHPPKRGRLYT
ncbi:hypothetical protein F4802DRAFT_591524 [Xylaria palmicola]|nr:hypothetical protein F4802DRAFT_591524 [Xylaria palmicola]